MEARAHRGAFLQAGASKNDLAEQASRRAMENSASERLSKRFLQAAAGSGLMGSSAGDARQGHGLAYPRLRCGPLAALLLAYNWFGDSFIEASFRLCGKTAGRCL
jgi:hypothetical protein